MTLVPGTTVVTLANGYPVGITTGVAAFSSQTLATSCYKVTCCSLNHLDVGVRRGITVTTSINSDTMGVVVHQDNITAAVCYQRMTPTETSYPSDISDILLFQL